jgi:hypothetical protein
LVNKYDDDDDNEPVAKKSSIEPLDEVDKIKSDPAPFSELLESIQDVADSEQQSFPVISFSPSGSACSSPDQSDHNSSNLSEIETQPQPKLNLLEGVPSYDPGVQNLEENDTPVHSDKVTLEGIRHVIRKS